MTEPAPASDPMALHSPAVVAALLRRHGIRPNRRRGQNFLVDANQLARVLAAAEVGPKDAVLEIGAGLGVLTRALSARAARVLAIEVDPALHQVLLTDTASDLRNTRVLLADFLELPLPGPLPEHLGAPPWLVVANIPYSITTPLLARLLEHPELFRRAVLMVQQEVAARLTAAPGTPEYGALTLFAHLHAEVRRLAVVPRRAFLPAPEVDSAIVRLDLLREPRCGVVSPGHYLAVVHAAFGQRRKRLVNALTGPPLHASREAAAAALAAAEIAPDRRGETLTPEEFARLAAALPQELPPRAPKLPQVPAPAPAGEPP